ncbi:hypothetical protein AC579_2591 [Pseudocercospora musae]|uniref:Uncharacterized protein n=1 Tax=Pseudocercospora musae TaxID=113226 RepID=A0A139IER4_9PEZI|nr:hypothetical protein AC579_2591 [Pseudocercospora musae]
MTAAQEVFDTVELLEIILLRLPIAAIEKDRRVCKFFRTVVDTSPVITTTKRKTKKQRRRDKRSSVLVLCHPAFSKKLTDLREQEARMRVADQLGREVTSGSSKLSTLHEEEEEEELQRILDGQDVDEVYSDILRKKAAAIKGIDRELARQRKRCAYQAVSDHAKETKAAEAIEVEGLEQPTEAGSGGPEQETGGDAGGPTGSGHEKYSEVGIMNDGVIRVERNFVDLLAQVNETADPLKDKVMKGYKEVNQPLTDILDMHQQSGPSSPLG